MRVQVDGGKYEYVFHSDGRSEVLRYGEPWRNVTGDKFIYNMAAEIEQLRQRVSELEFIADQRVMMIDDLRELIEKLTAERDEWKAGAIQRDNARHEPAGQITTLKSALREAKEAIDEIWYSNSTAIALKKKEEAITTINKALGE